MGGGLNATAQGNVYTQRLKIVQIDLSLYDCSQQETYKKSLQKRQ